MVVPKRAAILLDRIMVALHHALEDGDQEGVRKISQLYKDGRVPGRSGKIGRDTTSKLISNYGFKSTFCFIFFVTRFLHLNLLSHPFPINILFIVAK